MTRLYYLSLFCFLILASAACRSRQQATTIADSTQTAPTGQADAKPIELTDRLKALGLTPTGHWRGISLGDPMTAIAASEKEKPFEQDSKHVGYTVEFPNLESADFLYYQQAGRVSAIDVDLYLNTRPSVDAYTKDLTGYFSQRYGKPITKSGVTVWTGPKQEQISLKDVSKGKDFGLKIKITPAGVGVLTASTN